MPGYREKITAESACKRFCVGWGGGGVKVCVCGGGGGGVPVCGVGGRRG